MTLRGHVEGGVVVFETGQSFRRCHRGCDGRHTNSVTQGGREALMKFAGIFDDLPPDASANVDRILYGTPPE
jgi:hypothetical protein